MTETIRDSLNALRSAIDRFPAGGGPIDPAAQYAELLHNCPFATAVPTETKSSRQADLATRVAELGPWHQGPFPLGEDLVAGGAGSDEVRWGLLGAHLEGRLAGRRVLVVGCGAGYDAFAFAGRGADYVLACASPDEIGQAELLESVYESGVDFRTDAWETLDPAREGTFDVVHCCGLLHRVLEPMTLLRTVRRMTAGGGTLLIGSMMLDDPERSELLRFVPARHAGDSGCWFVPGRLAFRWMVETAGFAVQAELGETEGPRDGFPVVNGYLRAIAEQ